MRSILAALALLLACDPAPWQCSGGCEGCEVALPVRAFPCELSPCLGPVGAVSGLELVPSARGVEVVIVDEIGPGITGHGGSYGADGTQFAYLVRGQESCPLLLHEIGHALGLEHSAERGNAMHPKADALHLEPWQVEAMQAEADRLQRVLQ